MPQHPLPLPTPIETERGRTRFWGAATRLDLGATVRILARSGRRRASPCRIWPPRSRIGGGGRSESWLGKSREFSSDHGVIDADYRNPVGIVLFNHSVTDFTVKPGDRVTQMIVQVIATPEVAEVEDLEATVWRLPR
uniref:dUTP diphosphatase n=1 Tax=Aegilops tauschii TaxID=37682 RepID=M8B9A3_AEGTA